MDITDLRTAGNSTEMQDVAAALLLGMNKNFLDLGAAEAKVGNNTHLLQKKLGWKGCCFDLRKEGELEHNTETYKERGAVLHNVDCTTPAFLNILKENSIPQIVDYVSLDVDVASISALLNLVETGGYIFKFLTYEHDLHYSLNHELYVKRLNQEGALNERVVYENPMQGWPHPFSKEGIEVRKYRAKDLLQKRGYNLLFENVSIEVGGGLHPMEDWWINPQYFPEFVIDNSFKNLHFTECLKIIISVSKYLHSDETLQLIKKACFKETKCC